MILLKLTDGMGNQMFQYAYARYLQSIYGGKIYFDLTKLGGGTCTFLRLESFLFKLKCRYSFKVHAICISPIYEDC